MLLCTLVCVFVWCWKGKFWYGPSSFKTIFFLFYSERKLFVVWMSKQLIWGSRKLFRTTLEKPDLIEHIEIHLNIGNISIKIFISAYIVQYLVLILKLIYSNYFSNINGNGNLCNSTIGANHLISGYFFSLIMYAMISWEVNIE